MLLLTDAFLKREFKQLKKYYTVHDIKRTVAKIDTSFVSLSHLGYKEGRLMKLRMVGRVAGRLVVYVFVKNNLIVPLVIRLKEDKIFGENLSLNNKKGKALILRMLDLVMDDVKKGKYQKISL